MTTKFDEKIRNKIEYSEMFSSFTNLIFYDSRKYLTKTLIGGPIELEDTNFVKHFIVFHSWYKAENIIEKATVLKLFLSTIKPSQQLR